MHMSYVVTGDNVRLYLKDWGRGQPVILMHGWPLCSDTFDDLGVALVNAGMRAIAYDRRGFGRSDQPWDGYNYNTLADDLAAVIEHTGARDAVLIGFSMGGGEVARYMSRHGGERISKAVLISSVVPYMLKTDDNPDGVEQKTFDAISSGIQEDRAAYWASFFKQFYGVGMVSHPVSEEVLEWSRGMAMRASLRSTLECARAFSSTDFRADLKSFKVPTLIIHGTGDKTVPIDTSGRAAVRGIEGSQLLEYDGAPHGLFASHKEQLRADVLNFLRGSGVRPATVSASLADLVLSPEQGLLATP
jgi:non-heme chloroperoxidase